MFKMGLEPTAWVQSLALSLASWVTLVMSSSLVPSLVKWDSTCEEGDLRISR